MNCTEEEAIQLLCQPQQYSAVQKQVMEMGQGKWYEYY